VLAGPPTGAYRVAKFVARNRSVVSISAAALVALVCALVFSLWGWNRARSAEETLLRLSDQELLERYLAEATSLPFGRPSDVSALEEIEQRLVALLDHLPFLETQLEARRAETGQRTSEEAWVDARLAQLVAGLEELTGTTDDGNALARLRRRMHKARESAKSTIEAHADLWATAIESIADDSTCPSYKGLTITPQIGLIPLRHNEETTLWEFWMPISGTRPEISNDGELLVFAETAITFALIPSGAFTMGARLDSGGERPVHEVSLADAYFLATHELTQGQCSRLLDLNPSAQSSTLQDSRLRFDDRHPVESMDWQTAQDWMRLAGLTLPTEAQWEYAARAGTDTIFFFGDDPEELQDWANVLDQSVQGTNLADNLGAMAERWNDGFATHAPVGSFPPNPFGLYDVHGNVWEWVGEPRGDYSLPTDPCDGRRLDPDASFSLARGGSALRMRSANRAASRIDVEHGQFSPETGLRPARIVEPRER